MLLDKFSSDVLPEPPSMLEKWHALCGSGIGYLNLPLLNGEWDDLRLTNLR